MAVMPLFKNLDRSLPVREPLDGLAYEIAAESAETRARLGTRRAGPILQGMEAGQ
jgi:hypothetical protein